MKGGVWIFGDQVYRNASSLAAAGEDAPIVFVESSKFCHRRPYHWQKLVLIFSAMRHFADELKEAGRDVTYFKMADDFSSALAEFVRNKKLDMLFVMEPNDYDRAEAMPAIAKRIGCKIEVTPNNQFLATHDDFADWSYGKRSLVMESFYRSMRQRLGILMNADGTPMGGEWNFDKMNRVGKIPACLEFPKGPRFELDAITVEVIEQVHHHFKDVCFGGEVTISQMRYRFIWPVTPGDALKLLRDFLKRKLDNFGPYEDAMTERSWTLWHSHLSVAQNCGLIHPQTIVDETIEYALPLIRNGKLPINSLEGFIRQIIGWREFMRGMYWREMQRKDIEPYPLRNELGANNPLPDFYWTGETDINCVHQCVRPVIDYGISHHITRLMVLSNFALLHCISPQQVNEWFIYAYADGYEWITTPNVVGMSLYADGGIVATKPYISGGAYIDKMSDFCKGCRYDPKKSTGEDACPFTRAYWPFLAKHRKRLQKNPRTSLTIKGLDRFSKTEIENRARETEAWFSQLKKYEQD